MLLDLSSLHSVKQFSEQYARKGLPLNILVCNAAVFGGSLRCYDIMYRIADFVGNKSHEFHEMLTIL